MLIELPSIDVDEAFDEIGLSLTIILLVVAIVSRILHAKLSVEELQLYLFDMVEAMLYGMVYAGLALIAGPIPDVLFPPYDASISRRRLFFEVAGQAGLNVVLSTLVRDAVKLVIAEFIPDLGHKGDRTGTASGGGIILSTLLMSRQPQWKHKIALVDKRLMVQSPLALLGRVSKRG